ncbi:MAG: type II secretion system minor pseudopilin GspK [Marinicaulis sp.]|nr:type II secretion system minor pseudopilin GspK [Marinicaulis sp.]
MIQPYAQKTSPYRKRSQRGAALLIVLLLVATLSFIALAVTERTTLAASRAYNARARGEALWLALGAERLAVAALQEIVAASPDRMSLDAPWAQEPMLIPLDGGTARIFFADATACFNVNSFVATATGGREKPPPQVEMETLVDNYEIGQFQAEQLVSVIKDWIDPDNLREPQGAEDGTYETKPSPYKTAGGPIASISEIRAVEGVTREIYGSLKPLLCALPDENPSAININMLTPSDAPLLAAVLGPTVDIEQAAAIIARRPEGGFPDLASFLPEDELTSLGIEAAPGDRFALTSRYMQARAEIVYNDAVIEMTVDFAIEGSNVKVLARRLGPEE